MAEPCAGTLRSVAGAELFAETMSDGIRSFSAEPVKLREEEGQLDGRGLDVADVGWLSALAALASRSKRLRISWSETR